MRDLVDYISLLLCGFIFIHLTTSGLIVTSSASSLKNETHKEPVQPNLEGKSPPKNSEGEFREIKSSKKGKTAKVTTALPESEHKSPPESNARSKNPKMNDKEPVNGKSLEDDLKSIKGMANDDDIIQKATERTTPRVDDYEWNEEEDDWDTVLKKHDNKTRLFDMPSEEEEEAQNKVTKGKPHKQEVTHDKHAKHKTTIPSRSTTKTVKKKAAHRMPQSNLRGFDDSVSKEKKTAAKSRSRPQTTTHVRSELQLREFVSADDEESQEEDYSSSYYVQIGGAEDDSDDDGDEEVEYLDDEDSDDDEDGDDDEDSDDDYSDYTSTSGDEDYGEVSYELIEDDSKSSKDKDPSKSSIVEEDSKSSEKSITKSAYKKPKVEMSPKLQRKNALKKKRDWIKKDKKERIKKKGMRKQESIRGTNFGRDTNFRRDTNFGRDTNFRRDTNFGRSKPKFKMNREKDDRSRATKLGLRKKQDGRHYARNVGKRIYWRGKKRFFSGPRRRFPLRGKAKDNVRVNKLAAQG